jgi:hypothetical protein
MSVEARDSFALYLAISGPGPAAVRARREAGVEAVIRAVERWTGKLVFGDTRDEVVAALGPPDVDEPGALIYRLGNRPGYGYRFQVDRAHGLLTTRGFVRLGEPPAAPAQPHSPDQHGGYVAALARIGATQEEVARWLGAAKDWYGWWPDEVWVYPDGLEIPFRHGVVDDAGAAQQPRAHELHFRAVQLGRVFGVLYVGGENQGFCAAIHGYAPAAAPPHDLTRLLAQALAEQGTGELTPVGLAAAVDRKLRALAAEGPGAVSFAAVRADNRRVEVAVAGTLRVHRVVGDRVLDTTAVDRNAALGGPGEAALQTTRWPVDSPYRMVIVSDEYHGFRGPETYFPQLAADLAAGRAPMPIDRTYTTGLVTELTFA